jgi:hypothetical protein
MFLFSSVFSFCFLLDCFVLCRGAAQRPSNPPLDTVTHQMLETELPAIRTDGPEARAMTRALTAIAAIGGQEEKHLSLSDTSARPLVIRWPVHRPLFSVHSSGAAEAKHFPSREKRKRGEGTDGETPSSLKRSITEASGASSSARAPLLSHDSSVAPSANPTRIDEKEVACHPFYIIGIDESGSMLNLRNDLLHNVARMLRNLKIPARGAPPIADNEQCHFPGHHYGRSEHRNERALGVRRAVDERRRL